MLIIMFMLIIVFMLITMFMLIAQQGGNFQERTDMGILSNYCTVPAMNMPRNYLMPCLSF